MKAVEHVQDFKLKRANHKLINYFMHNRPKPSQMGVFSVASWNATTDKDDSGFFMIDANSKVVCVGLSPSILAAKVEMEIMALIVALKTVKEIGERCYNIYISSRELWAVLHGSAEEFFGTSLFTWMNFVN